jgi:hypothetical protein
MEDLPIRNRYKAYKEGTESLVRWITRKASRYSNAAEVLRQLAGPGRGATILTTRDLITLTKLVVANGAVEIPEDILKITQDVVAEREVCANWYKNQNMNGELTASDKTHAYFIDTLHEIHHILESARHANALRAQEYPQKSPQPPSESIHTAFNNLFQHLEVEEPVENPLGTTTGTVEGFTAADKLAFQLERQKGDKAFAIWCLLEDFKAVREYIAGVWKDYRAGRKSLLAAGAITESAFGLMRHANEDFANGNGDVATYQAMIAFLEEEMLLPIKDDRASTDDKSSKSETMDHEDTRKTAGRRKSCAVQNQDMLLCREAGKLFEALIHAFRGGVTDAGSLPPSCLLGTESPLGVFGDTLLKLVPAIQQCAGDTVDYRRDHNLVFDEFLSALVNHALDSGFSQVPVWLVAAGQSYQEIYAVLNGKMSRGSKDLRSYLHQIRPNVKEAQGIFKLIPTRNPQKVQRNMWLLRIGDDSFSAQFDASKQLDQIAEAQNWNFTSETFLAVLAHFLSLYPCMVNYHCRYFMQGVGRQFLSDGMSVNMTAHLFKAGQRYGLIKSTWEDMEFILANHVTYTPGRPGTQPIVPKPSKRDDPFQMVASLRTTLGYPPVDLDKALRPRLVDDPGHKWRKLTHRSDLLHAMPETSHGVRHLQSTDREFINIVLRKLRDSESKGKNKGRSTATKYTLVELLVTYEKHLTAEEPGLNFDYIGFFRHCCGDLEALSILYRPKHLSSELHELVDYLLWTAADVVRKSKHRSPEELHQALLKTTFGVAVIDLERAVKMGSSEFLKPALESSSGHLPRHMWPSEHDADEQVGQGAEQQILAQG